MKMLFKSNIDRRVKKEHKRDKKVLRILIDSGWMNDYYSFIDILRDFLKPKSAVSVCLKLSEAFQLGEKLLRDNAINIWLSTRHSLEETMWNTINYYMNNLREIKYNIQDKLIMDKNLKEVIAPRWIEEQQGVYIPLIDKVLLKDNVPGMPYDDFMGYAQDNNVKIATKEELLQMYLQKDEINTILKEHNGDLLDGRFGSSSEYCSPAVWVVNFDSGCCSIINKIRPDLSRAVVALK